MAASYHSTATAASTAVAVLMSSHCKKSSGKLQRLLETKLGKVFVRPCKEFDEALAKLLEATAIAFGDLFSQAM